LREDIERLCRRLKPVLGKKIDRLWSAYLAESDSGGKADIQQTLELLAARYLNKNFQPEENPFPPPSKDFARAGQLRLGDICYAGRKMYPFYLKADRLKEHILIAGRSGSGKTNLAFILIDEIIDSGVNVLALDWKRSYRDLKQNHKDLQVYTIGRDIAPFRFNPLIPPSGCEPQLWIKQIVDVIASAYLGGEGVISLLVAGLDHLYRKAGVYDKQTEHWPTVYDLLGWLRNSKLKGRAAQWKASAERILLAMTYGEFGEVINTTDNSHLATLLRQNVILEMDGLSSSSDKTMFSEALTLYLYRHRLAGGPQDKLTNVIVLEEAHNLLLKKSSESKESVLETSIRMVRQYGLGFMFIDQSASLLSKVAFANSYAIIALSQKLRSDVTAIASAMNLSDEQKQSLSKLSVGRAVVRLADEHTESFQVKIPRCSIQEGGVADSAVRSSNRGGYSNTGSDKLQQKDCRVIPDVSGPDKNKKDNEKSGNKDISHPPSPGKDPEIVDNPPEDRLNREETRFLADVAARPLSTTVSRYQRLSISRRKGNAIRRSLCSAGILERFTIPTRSGQVVLYDLTDIGQKVCTDNGIQIPAKRKQSLEHMFWVKRAARFFEDKGYDVSAEHPIKGNGAVDLLAASDTERIAVEVETGKSHIKRNIENAGKGNFDKVVVLATSASAVSKCRKAVESKKDRLLNIELLTWLDIS
jgi:hypothetical protein